MSEYSQLIQMITALTNRLNDIEINGKKIDELNQLSTLNPSSKIHVSVGGQSFYVEVSQLIDAISNANHDHIVSIAGDITKTGNDVTVPATVGLIGNVIYETTANTVVTIPYCATGLIRKDILVLNTSNQIVLISGFEDADIAIRPNIPINTLLVTEIDVTDAVVGTPTDPILGTQFIKKQEYAETAIEGTGEITIDLTGESTAFRILSNTIAKIKGFNASSEFMSQIFYIGKEIRLINDSGTDIILNHNDTSTAWPFRFPTEVDFVWKNKHVVIFRPTKTDAQYLEFQSDSVDVASSSKQRYYMHVKIDGTALVTINTWYSHRKSAANYDQGAIYGDYGTGSSPVLATLFGSGIPITPPKDTYLVDAWYKAVTSSSWGAATLEARVDTNETLDDVSMNPAVPNNNQLPASASWTPSAAAANKTIIKQLTIHSHNPFTEFTQMHFSARKQVLSGSAVTNQEYFLTFEDA